MHAFKYHRPSSLKDAAALAKGDAKLLAGGQTLVQTMKLRLASPSDIIDLGTIKDLAGIKSDGKSVTVGAMTRHADVAHSAEVKKAIPALAALAATIGDRQVRAMGTIGGSLANNDPAADYPAAVLALGATIHTNKRTIAAADFFTGMFSTALGEGEIVTKVALPVPAKAAYQKFDNPASRYAMAGVFVARMKDGSVRVGVTGASSGGVFRATDIEKALSASWSPDAVAGVTVSPDGMLSDIHGSAAYRANLVKVMAKRAVAAAG